ncbi:MAG: serine/threonine-protein kinase [Verrucomicrobiota bacterium]|nr:serine/threonine-protein kinase [Verrucomicrobiota bacterium]
MNEVNIDPTNLPEGYKVDGYIIKQEIGRGNMGIVYKALQENLQRFIALKILYSDVAEDKGFVKNFIREARSAGAFSHLHIVQAYDVGISEDGLYYFAMELVDGTSIGDEIREQGKLKPKEAIDIMVKIAEALEYGYKTQRLTHGDIKPENILLTQVYEPKLADLGLAKTIRDELQIDNNDLILTPLYGAPELIKRKWQPGDPRADIYAFGATLFHMLAGMPPFSGSNPDKVLQRHLKEDPPQLDEIINGFSHELSQFIDLLLEKDPDKRPSSWTQVKDKLKKINLNSTRVERRKSSKTARFSTRRKKISVTRHGKTSSIERNKKNKKDDFVKLIYMMLFIVLALFIAFGVIIKNDVPRTEPKMNPLQNMEALRQESPEMMKDFEEMKQRLQSLDNLEFKRNHVKVFIKKYGEQAPQEAFRMLEEYSN